MHFILFKRKREIRLLSLYIYNEICCLLRSLKNVLRSFNQCISSFIDNNFSLCTRQMWGYWDVLRLSFKSFSFMPLYELQSWRIFSITKRFLSFLSLIILRIDSNLMNVYTNFPLALTFNCFSIFFRFFLLHLRILYPREDPMTASRIVRWPIFSTNI